MWKREDRLAVRPADLANRLVARAHEERAQYARQADRVRAGLRRPVIELIRAGRVQQAWLIGSLTTGRFGVRSDADVVVRGLAREDAAMVWRSLEQAVGAPVDLLRFEELEPGFQARVIEEGVEFRVT